jgi:hypothetical protein
VPTFMLEIERRVNLMVGEYAMNEYKAYKALVKHKRRINRVFSEVCGDKSFHSRCPGRKLNIPRLLLPVAQLLPQELHEDLPRVASRLPMRLHPLAFNLRKQGLLNRRSANARLPNKF